jgi:hypothetical protein
MKDIFSLQAGSYASYRPGYPPELFDFIVQHIKNRDTAWDCATGNGQTATHLARYFGKVLATDISQKQLDNASRADNIVYSVQPAEQTDLRIILLTWSPCRRHCIGSIFQHFILKCGAWAAPAHG